MRTVAKFVTVKDDVTQVSNLSIPFLYHLLGLFNICNSCSFGMQGTLDKTISLQITTEVTLSFVSASIGFFFFFVGERSSEWLVLINQQRLTFGTDIPFSKIHKVLLLLIRYTQSTISMCNCSNLKVIYHVWLLSVYSSSSPSEK